MDLLAQHEAFLRAIFDVPEDDTPRLVYADFLEEYGLPKVAGPGADLERGRFRADLIRAQCALARATADPETSTARLRELAAHLDLVVERVGGWPVAFYERGFPSARHPIRASPKTLLDTTDFRLWSVTGYPHVFAATELQVAGGRIVDDRVIDVIFQLPALAKVTTLTLSGGLLRSGDGYGILGMLEYELVPVITPSGVEALARHRGMMRIAALDLRNNDLDSDAARALISSPFLDNLKSLRLLEGNRLRGRVWQQVIERFGEEIVG